MAKEIPTTDAVKNYVDDNIIKISSVSVSEDGGTVEVEVEESDGTTTSGSTENIITKSNMTESSDSFPSDTYLGKEVWRSDLDAFFKYNGDEWIEI